VSGVEVTIHLTAITKQGATWQKQQDQEKHNQEWLLDYSETGKVQSKRTVH
jgi:hypothetical protein